MPVYEYRCLECHEVTEKLRSLEEYRDPLDCSYCGGATKKIVSIQRVHPDFEPYYDDNLECGIKSKQHRKKVMQEQGVTELYGKGWR